MDNKNYLSYKTFLNDIKKFKKSGGTQSDEFNIFDNISQYYFKIFFYFHNGDESMNNYDSSIYDTGLLAPTWEDLNEDSTDFYAYNSAWAYFKMNADDYRAEKVKQFVTLLSNISSESPWYFSELSGLDSALERKSVMERDFKIDEQRYKISIKCLPDAIDDRIGTLLDLYRDISFDWINKLQLLPANLKKFDMGIYVFNSAIQNIHGFDHAEDSFAELNVNSSHHTASYKYFELHNCEIDYNSSKSAYSTLNNKDGFQKEYTIDILFDDIYELRYNEFLFNIIGDLILNIEDNKPLLYLSEDKLNNSYDELDNRVNFYKYILENLGIKDADMPDSNNIFDIEKPNTLKELKSIAKSKFEVPDFSGFVSGAAEQGRAAANDFLKSSIKKVLLGNLHTLSISRVSDQLNSLASGNILGAVNTAQNYYNNFKKKINSGSDELGKLYEKNTNIAENNKIKNLGNLFKNQTLLNTTI